MAIETLLGRRDQNKADKRSRIEAAAAELFFERGYSGVSTLALAERAGVATGTVFRYAATKPELFLMSYNDQFAAAIQAGVRASKANDRGDGGITAMLLEIFERASQMPENASVYQRELMFGQFGGTFANQGLGLVQNLQQLIAGRLGHLATARGRQVDDQVLRAAADAIFACLHVAVARLGSTGTGPDRADRDAIAGELGTQVRLLVAGVVTHDADAATRDTNTPYETGRTLPSVGRSAPMTTT